MHAEMSEHTKCNLRVNQEILNYIKTLQLGSLMSIETLKDLADSTSAPVTGNVTILPSKIIGDFQRESSEGFDEFMYEIGVNMFTRTIECLSALMKPEISTATLNTCPLPH